MYERNFIIACLIGFNNFSLDLLFIYTMPFLLSLRGAPNSEEELT